MSRPPDPRRTQLIGLIVATVTGVGIVGMYSFATGDPYRGEATIITAHFSSVSGLKKGSDVRLSGKLVGRVDNVAFVTASYDCNPDMEDLGRDATDDCEPWLFCAHMPDAVGQCAALLPYTGTPSDYADVDCLIQEQCKDSEVCWSETFRRANPDVSWYGPDNTCVPFQIDHQRVEVRMAIHTDKLPYISRDSKVSVASKGPLGDQEINIDYGNAESIEPGERLQAKPTLLEELNDFRERISVATGRFSDNLGSFRELRGSMKTSSDAPPRDMRTNLARLADATNEIATHQGQLGELFHPDAREDALASLRDLRSASDDTSRDIVNWRRKNVSKVHELGKDMGTFAKSAQAAANPESGTTASKLLTDERFGIDIAGRVSSGSDSIGSAGQKLADVHEDVLELRQQLRDGEGTLGELVRNPDLYYSFVKAISLFDLFDRNDGFKSLVRSVIAASDDYEGLDPALDRAQPRSAPKPAASADAPTPTDTDAPPPAPTRGPPPPPPSEQDRDE